MVIKFCRDCANFEDRRDIDGTTLCAKYIGPYVCCEEFEPKHESINANRLYNRFCAECSNFEDVNGIPLCAKVHNPRVACDGFQNRLEKSNGTKQNNLAKNAILTYTLTHYNPTPIPAFVTGIAKKITW